MFNYAEMSLPFATLKVVGGLSYVDGTTHKTLFAGMSFINLISKFNIFMIGQDPADPSRALVRKIVQVSPKTYCLEEVRITPVEGKRPTVHT